jgi:hypothetical protein
MRAAGPHTFLQHSQLITYLQRGEMRTVIQSPTEPPKGILHLRRLAGPQQLREGSLDQPRETVTWAGEGAVKEEPSLGSLR